MHILRLCSVFEIPSHVALDGLAGFDPIGGMQNHTGELTRALAKSGVRQTVVTAHRPGVPTVERSQLVEVRRVGVALRHWRQLYGIAAVRHVASLASHVDIIHVHQGEDLATIPLGLLAKSVANVPMVITFHCSVGHTFVPRDASQRLMKAIGTPLEPLGMKRADAIIVLTSRLRSLVAQHGIAQERIHVIPPGINGTLFDEVRQDPLPGLRRPRVLFVGRLVPQKNPLSMVRAANLIDEAADIVIVGDGPERQRIEEEIADAGLGGRIHLTGFIPHDEIPSYLCHADVFAMPSQYEELGSVLLEAMRTGLAIVASDTGGIPEVIEDGRNGLLVPPDDVVGFARAVNRLLRDREFAQAMSNEGRRRSLRYEWSQLAGEVLNVYAPLTK
jgi:2-deoxystreptamine N-acetyl-D-glucosaminyltransferase/2-deoxystreptamine glucosyltransferase